MAPASSGADRTDTAPPGWVRDSYDAWFERSWGRYAFGVEATALLSATGPLRERLVADVGCGTGRLLGPLRAAGARALGVDPDPGMLSVSASRVSAPLVRGEGSALPLASGCLDVTVAVTVLEFVDDPADTGHVDLRRGRSPSLYSDFRPKVQTHLYKGGPAHDHPRRFRSVRPGRRRRPISVV